MRFLGHSTVRLELAGSVVLTDPLRTRRVGPLRRIPPAPDRDEASPFEPHVGSHGGMGGAQSRGFVLHPAQLPPPGEIVGAEALHRVLRGRLTDLGHPEPQRDEPSVVPTVGR